MGALLRDRAGRGRVGRGGDRGPLQAARPVRPRADRPGRDRRRARRQARHAGRLLGDRREADRQQGPLRAAARRARGDPHRAGERAAAAGSAPADRARHVRRSGPRLGNRELSSVLERDPRSAATSCPVARSASTDAAMERARRSTSVRELRWHGLINATIADLLAFFADRLKVQLREQGARHDLVDAVFAARQPGRPPARSSAASRRWARSSTPRTAGTCSPATAAPPTSSATRRRSRARVLRRGRSGAATRAEEMALYEAVGAAEAAPRLRSRPRTSTAPCRRSRSSRRRSTPSSTRCSSTRRPGRAREPPPPPQPHPRGDADRRRFLEDRRLAARPRREVPLESVPTRPER